MPRTDNLPAALHPLARRNAIEISDTRFLSDCERLTSAIARVIEPIGSTAEPPPVQNHHASPKDQRVGSSTSTSLAKFKAVLWTCYAVELLGLLVSIHGAAAKGVLQFSNLVVNALLFGLGAWIIVVLPRGKNWARIAYAALLAVTYPLGFLGFALGFLPGGIVPSGAEFALTVVGFVLSVWAIRIMFTDPVKQIFKRH